MTADAHLWFALRVCVCVAVQEEKRDAMCEAVYGGQPFFTSGDCPWARNLTVEDGHYRAFPAGYTFAWPHGPQGPPLEDEEGSGGGSEAREVCADGDGVCASPAPAAVAAEDEEEDEEAREYLERTTVDALDDVVAAGADPAAGAGAGAGAGDLALAPCAVKLFAAGPEATILQVRPM